MLKKLQIIFFILFGFINSTFAADEIIGVPDNTAITIAITNGYVGQSFQATKTGVLSSISIVGKADLDYTLTIYNGSGTSGTLLHSQSVNIPNTYTSNTNYTLTTLPISAAVNLTNGNTYTFVFTRLNCNLVATNLTAYAGGGMYNNNSISSTYDMIFKVTQGDRVNALPTDIGISSSTLAENSAVNTIIGDLNITDADVGDTATLSFCGGVNDGNFTLDGTTLKSNYVFDYETTTSQSVCIRATDSASATFDKNITIDITNLNDNTPTVSSTAITSVNEDSAYTYTLIGSDADGDDLNWSVKNGITLPSWLTLDSVASVTTLAGTVGSSGSTNANGTSASFSSPSGVALDSIGNVYVADKLNHLIRKIDTNGNVTTLAGTAGSSGSTNANGTFASFSSPSGVAVDSSGNVYVADKLNHLIRKIAPNGDVTTLAGTAGSSGSTNANGTSASFNNPYGVAVDSSGNVYVTDTGNHLVRKITPNGDVTTLAGTAGTTGSTNANGTSASFNNPYGVAVDSSGNVYVADTGNHLVRKIAPNGDVTTLAGTGTIGSTDENGTSASFYYPTGVAVDSAGNVYVAGNNNPLIRKIAPDGDVTTLAGTETIGSTDANGTSASFYYPTGVAVDSSGNAYVADTGNNLIRKISISTKLTGTPTKNDVGTHNINLILSDGTTDVEHNFQITVNGKPVITSTPSTSIEATSTYRYELQATDIENQALTWSVASGSTLPSWLTLSSGILSGTPTNDDVGEYAIKLVLSDGKADIAHDFKITVSLFDYPPVLSAINAQNTSEDGEALNIILSVSDVDNDAITYTVNSSDSSIATASIVNGELVVTPIPNANGKVTIEVIAKSNNKTSTQSFDVDIAAINDTPTIVTSFINTQIDEDFGTKSFKLKVSDLEGDDIKVSVTSSNMEILSVTPKWTDIRTQADWSNELQFDLVTQENKNGKVTITVTAEDEFNAKVSTTFDVDVIAVDDIPTIDNISDVIVYKNSKTKTIELIPKKDVDDETLVYSATTQNNDLIKSIDFVENIMTINFQDNVSGKGEISLKVADTNNEVLKTINFNLLPLEDGEDTQKVGDISTVTTNNTTTTSLNISNELTVQSKEDSTTGFVEHDIIVNNKEIKAISQLVGSIIEFIEDGVKTTYTDSYKTIEVKANVTGQAEHTLTINGKTTKATSEFVGAQTLIKKDANDKVEIETSVQVNTSTSVKVIAKEDGTAEHSVSNGISVSKATSKVEGAQTIIDSNGNVQTSVGNDSLNGYTIKALVQTDTNGKSNTTFLKVNDNDSTDMTTLGNTVKSTTPFDIGNSIDIEKIDGKLYFKIETPLSDTNLVIE